MNSKTTLVKRWLIAHYLSNKKIYIYIYIYIYNIYIYIYIYLSFLQFYKSKADNDV